MWDVIYNGYMGLALAFFGAVGALSVCCIACLVFLMLARACYELAIAIRDDYEEYKFFKYHEANFVLWLDSNGYKMERDEEHNRTRWVKK